MKKIFVIILIHSLNTSAQTTNQYRIAYNVAVKDSAGKTNYEVFSMNFDGSDKINISQHKDVSWTYRAFGKRLFFISDRDTCYRCFFLYETDAYGKDIKKISGLQLEDSWMDSRDKGREMIVSGRINKLIRHQLFKIDTKTGNYIQLTNDTAAKHTDPAFSPDGKKVAFAYRRNKGDKAQHEEIFIMNIDGTGLQQLTRYPQNNISRNGNGYKAGATHWHPVENFISYISMQDGRHQIFAVSTDGKKQWKLTKNEFTEGYHDWSPDGKWLVFDMANKEETQYHIMLMNWETKEIKQLTDNTHKYHQSPVFVEVKK